MSIFFFISATGGDSLFCTLISSVRGEHFFFVGGKHVLKFSGVLEVGARR